MPTIIINDKVINAADGATVLQTALENGIYIPHFCWHPALSIAGNCRMCAVEIVGRPKLEVSCNLPVAEGMVIKTDTENVKKMRKSVLEFLLINHPIDCPICDQAGECLLQDFHFKYSGQLSRFKEKKVHKPKVVEIGNYIKLDDERCVLCTRCVRFCHETARAPELTVVSRGDRSYITTSPGKRLDNPYSLNTVDICPVGALTSKDFRFKKRVWFLKSTPSICPHCSNGCPIWIDHESGSMYRWRPRQVDGLYKPERGITDNQMCGKTFLCDEGRLKYKEWQGDEKLTKPIIQTEVGFAECDLDNAKSYVVNLLKSVRPEDVVGFVSAQCSCEEIDSFVGYLKNHVKTDKIYKIKRRFENPTEDNIIIKRDKNPNSKHLENLGLENFPIDVSGGVLFILDTINSDDLMKIVNFKWKGIVQIVHDKSLIVPGVNLVLPRTTIAEMNGTFVNHAGTCQKFEKAYEPIGDARSVVEWSKLLSA